MNKSVSASAKNENKNKQKNKTKKKSRGLSINDGNCNDNAILIMNLIGRRSNKRAVRAILIKSSVPASAKQQRKITTLSFLMTTSAFKIQP